MTIGQSAEILDEMYAKLPPPDPNSPRVVFPSDMILTRKQEEALCQHAAKRFIELDEELGREVTRTDIDGSALFLNQRTEEKRDERLFMAKRLLYQHVSENDFSWRPLLMPGSIFAKSNLIVPLARRITRQMSARAIGYFFGTDPWLAVSFVGLQDEALAKALNQLVQWKLTQEGNQDRIRGAVSLAFELGECVLKTTATRNASFYRKKQTVAVDSEGNPLLATDGLPITPDDEWMQGEMGSVLKRDGQTAGDPRTMQFEEKLLDEELVHYQGPITKIVYFRDFLCPLNATDVQSADCICHVMDYSANELAADYMQNPGASLENLQAAIEAIRQALNQGDEHKAFSASRPELNESIEPTAPSPTMEIGEFYLRFDADGDGYMEDIMLVMDLQTQTPIYYNYTAAITDDGLRPFTVIRPKPVINRWYGQGSIEIFESYQNTVDLLINRRNRAQSEAGRVTLWRPHNTLEGEANPHLKLNWGKNYTPREGKTKDDVLEVVYLDDNKYDKLTDELQFFLQLAMNESGVQHANDNFVAGMDSAKLATGIRNIEKTGMELFGVFISDLEPGITATAKAFVNCTYKNLDQQETFTYLEGDVPQELTIAAKDVRNLKFNVSVTLSRYKAEQNLMSAGQAVAIIRDYYTLPPQAQIDLAPLYIMQLESLQIQNPERFIIPRLYSLPPMGSPMPEPQAEDAQPIAPPPNL